MKTLSIRCSSEEQGVGQLSGGNQQKVVIAKWLFRDSDVLIFDEPTRGIDIGARFEIYRLLGELAEQGKAILFVSSDSHRGASAIDWDEFGTYCEYGVNKGINNYSYFKLILSTFGCELARRLAPGGAIDVPVHVMCPGPVNSDIVRDAPPLLKAFLKAVFTLVFRAPEAAARPAVYMCVSPDFETETNRYLHMFNPKRMDEKCYDEVEGSRLWERTFGLLREVDAWPQDDVGEDTVS